MDKFNIFIDYILTQRPTAKTLSNTEQAYVTRLSNNPQDIQKEYVILLAHIIIDNDKDKFLRLIDVLIPQACECPIYQLDLLEPLFVVFRPTMSELLKRSHLFCDCEPYISGHVNRWKTDHNDIFDTEMYFYTYVHEKFNHLISIDTQKYDFKELISGRKPPSNEIKPHSIEEKLKQMYTVVYYYDTLLALEE